MTFKQLQLNKEIRKALDEMGYSAPTPIQEQAIPPVLEGRDVLGCAQTGTGKTCAYAAPILQRLSQEERKKGRPIRALILTPTRELAIQIDENIRSYGKYLSLKSEVIYGGVGQNPQTEALKRGVDILTATPGRLMDLYQQKFLRFDDLEVLVLDEADRMLDMGFIHDVEKILSWLPDQKQTLLFSATMPPEVQKLVDSLLHKPVRVTVGQITTPVESIKQRLYYVDRGNKIKLLSKLLKLENGERALVFTRTKHGANQVARELGKAGISAAAIHGNKSQSARQQALSDFKDGKISALVATDIAARGLDIEDLAYVINYNLPDVPETYIHRIGRTGRAGKEGEAISFCDASELDELKEIEKHIGIQIPVFEDPDFPVKSAELIQKTHGEKTARMGVQGKQKAGKASSSKGRSGNAPEKARKAEQQKPKKRETVTPPSGRKYPKPVLRPAEALSDYIKNTETDETVDFVKPDPLAGEHIMDATARLLASAQKKKTGNGRKIQRERNKNRKKEGSSTPEKVTSRARGSGIKMRAESGKTDSHNKSGKSPQERAHAEQIRREYKSRGKKYRGMPERKEKIKDSTEQGSLIKPHYIKHD